MIDRKKLGVVQDGLDWPRISVPNPVKKYFWNLASQYPQATFDKVGFGYHNAGWSYEEIEIRALSLGRACEVAEEIYGWTIQEFQLTE